MGDGSISVRVAFWYSRGRVGGFGRVVLLALLRDYDDTTTTAFSMMIMTGMKKIDSLLHETEALPS